MNEQHNPLGLTFALLTGTTALGDDVESIAFWLKTGVSILLSLISIFFIVYDRVKAAKKKGSDGDEKITMDEAIDIAKAAAEEIKTQLDKYDGDADNKEKEG